MADQPLLSLSEIAGVDLMNVQEIRFLVLPEMAARWKVKEAKLETLGQDNKAAIVVECEAIAVEQIVHGKTVPQDAKAEDFVGKTHREAWIIKKPEDIGRFKAFLVDVGVQFTGPAPLQAILPMLIGLEFPGKIKHRVDREDKERIYANVHPVVQQKAAA